MAGRGKPTSSDTPVSLVRVLGELRAKTKVPDTYSEAMRATSPVPINKIIESEKARREKITNDIKESDQQLKKTTLKYLFMLLFVETAVVFVLAFMQGLKAWNFAIDTVSLRIIIVATLAQISAMLTIAVRHLFPTKK